MGTASAAVTVGGVKFGPRGPAGLLAGLLAARATPHARAAEHFQPENGFHIFRAQRGQQ